ncbi:hypothetical protein [Micromonospora sp. NPDC023644]|uniref:hypothetical protein n=1 Tax=Micromonospora sp. NPDC023644 TaxID=3154321 RepID=UPI0033C97C1D
MTTDLAAEFGDLPLGPGDCLVLTGSRVLPFAVSGDDLDLMLFSTDPATHDAYVARRHSERLSEQLANGFVMAYLAHRDGSELDVELWPTDTVTAAIGAVGDGIHDVEAVERDFTRVGGLEVKVGTDLFHALWYGRPLRGADTFARLRGQVNWSTYFAWKRDTQLINVRDAVKGIAKSLKDDRPDEAYLKLCWAADSLVDGLIFHAGHSISRWKWRLRYLDLIDPAVSEWYRQVRFGTDGDRYSRESLLRDREVLRSSWEKYSGTKPALHV